jgi:protein-tyrosine phosphatase
MSDGIDVPLNYNRITNRLLLGSRPQTPADVDALAAVSVSHILNVCATDDTPNLTGLFKTDSTRYLWNVALDDSQPKPVDWFQRSLRFAMPLLAQEGNIIYVHCYNGIDRSAATVYAILQAFGLSAVDAWALIKLHRPVALWRYMDDATKAVGIGW